MKTIWIKAALKVLFVGALLWVLLGPEDDAWTGTVDRVTGGDTLDFQVAEGPVVRLRLWGIDAAGLDEPGGAEAADYLRRLTEGRTLECEPPPIGEDQGPENHAVRLCRIDGRDIAQALVDAGHAVDAPDYSDGRYAAR